MSYIASTPLPVSCCTLHGTDVQVSSHTLIATTYVSPHHEFTQLAWPNAVEVDLSLGCVVQDGVSFVGPLITQIILVHKAICTSRRI